MRSLSASGGVEKTVRPRKSKTGRSAEVTRLLKNWPMAYRTLPMTSTNPGLFGSGKSSLGDGLGEGVGLGVWLGVGLAVTVTSGDGVRSGAARWASASVEPLPTSKAATARKRRRRRTPTPR